MSDRQTMIRNARLAVSNPSTESTQYSDDHGLKAAAEQAVQRKDAGLANPSYTVVKPTAQPALPTVSTPVLDSTKPSVTSAGISSILVGLFSTPSSMSSPTAQNKTTDDQEKAMTTDPFDKLRAYDAAIRQEHDYIIAESENAQKEYDAKMAAFTEANNAYNEWLLLNQSQEIMNEMSVNPDDPKWESMAQEGQRLYKVANDAYSEADAARSKSDSLHDTALYLSDMRTLNELLPKLDQDTRQKFEVFAKTGIDPTLSGGGLYEKMREYGISESELESLAATWRRYENGEFADEIEELGKKYSDLLPITASVTSLGTKLIAPVSGTLATLLADLDDSPYRSADPNGLGYAPEIFSDSIRGNVESKIEGNGSNSFRTSAAYLYTSALGAADNTLRNLVYGPTVAPVMAAMDTFQSTARSSSQKGCTKGESLALGLACGSIEYLTEQSDSELFADLFVEGKPSKNMKEFLQKAAASIGNELPEEMTSFFASAAAEAVILREKSDVGIQIKKNLSGGKSQKKAAADAWKEYLWEGAIQTAIDTVFSSVFQSAFGEAVNQIMHRAERDSQKGMPSKTSDSATTAGAAAHNDPSPDASASQAHAYQPLSDADIMDATVSGEPVGAAQTAQEAVDTAVTLAMQQGKVSNNQATRILQTPGAVELLQESTGMELPGTASGNRAAVKNAILTLAAGTPSALPDASAPSRGSALAPSQGELSPQATEGVSSPQMTPAEQAALELARLTNTPNYPGLESTVGAQENSGDTVTSAAQTAPQSSAIAAAISCLQQTGSVSDSIAAQILNDPEAITYLQENAGLQLPGDQDGNIAAVKNSVMTLFAYGPRESEKVDTGTQTNYNNTTASQGGNYDANGLQQNDRAGSSGDPAQGLAGVQSADRAEHQGRNESGGVAVDSGIVRLSTQLRNAFSNRGTNTNGGRSQEVSNMIERLNRGGQDAPSIDEILTLPEILTAEKANEGTETIQLPNREQIRENGYQKAMQKCSWNGSDYSGEVRQEKRMDIVIGLPGSGKSSVYTERLSQEHKSRVIDTDDFREYIPEYNGTNAAIVHEEASGIRNKVLDTALDAGDNILLSTIGANVEKLARQIAQFKEEGYQVYLHLNELPNNKSLARAIGRYISEDGSLGRYVSPKLIAEYGDKPTQTYLYLTGQGGNINGRLESNLRQSGGQSSEDVGRTGGTAESQAIPGNLLAGYDWYNNDVGKGQAPRLIQSSEDAALTNHSVGAADQNFTGLADYDALLSDDNVQPERASDARHEEFPRLDADGRQVSRFASNAGNSAAIGEQTVDQIKREIMAGTFSLDTQDMESVLNTARDHINKVGTSAAEQEIYDAVTKGKQNEHIIAQAQLLFVQYANSQDVDSQRNAGTMLAYLSALSSSAGRQLNMFKLMRKLTPEGKLAMVSRNVENFVSRHNRRNSTERTVQIPDAVSSLYLNAADDTLSNERAGTAHVAAAIEGTVADQLDAAIDAAIDTVIFSGESSESTTALPANETADRLGQRVADSLTRRAQQRNLSMEDMLYQDLMSFANDKAALSRNGENLRESRSLRALRDYYQNRALFQTAWDNARARVQQAMNTMAPDDPRLARLEAFFTSAGIENTSPIMRSFDWGNPGSTLRRGVKDAAREAGYTMSNSREKTDTVRQQLRDVLTENWQNKQQAALRIAQVINDQLGLDGEAAAEMARDVTQAFYVDLAERGARRVSQMFDGKTRETVRTSLTKRLAQLYNMGAFSNSDYRQAAFDSIFGKKSGVDIPDGLMEQFVTAADDSLAEAEHAIYACAASQLPGTLKEKVDAWRHMAMLGNVRTQMRNSLGNAAFRPFVDAKRTVGSVLERAFLPEEQRTKSVIGFGQESRAIYDWAKADAKSQASKEAMSYTGLNGDQARSKIDDLRTIYKTAWLDAGRRGLKDAMSLEDMFFKNRTYATSLAGFLKARGVTAEQLTSGTVDAALLEEARLYAVQEAMKATFNDENAISDLFVNLRYRGDNYLGKAINTIGEAILPYRRTPANIIARAWEYSPVSGAKALVWDSWHGLRNGTISGAQFIDRLSASLTGTGALALGVFLGRGLFGVKLIGSEPDEEEKAAGHKPYSLVIGDVSIPIEWMAPAAIPILVGANLGNMSSENEDASLAERVANGLYAVVNAFDPMLDMSMLSTLNDLLETGKYKSEDEPAAFYDLLTTGLTSYARQFVPTLFGHFERAGEGQKTETYAPSDHPAIAGLQKYVGDISKNIPGLDLYQIEALDEWGRPEETRSNRVLRALEDVFAPAAHTESKLRPIDEELLRLQKAQPETVTMTEPQKTISYKGTDGTVYKDYRLPGEQWDEIKRQNGAVAESILSDMFEDPIYQGMTDTEKAKAVNLAYDYARDTARIEVLDDYPGYSSKWMADIGDDPVSAILTRAYSNAQGTAGNVFSIDKHNEMVSAGVSDSTAKDVQAAVAALLPEKDGGNVRDIQKLEAIMDMSGLTVKEGKSALHAYLGDSMDRKFDTLTGPGYGLSNEDFVETYRAWLDTEGKKDEKLTAIALAIGRKKTDPLVEQIYKVYNGNTK